MFKTKGHVKPMPLIIKKGRFLGYTVEWHSIKIHFKAGL